MPAVPSGPNRGKGESMRKYILTAVAVAAVSSPALARDGQPYVGIEGGVLFPKEQDGDVFVDYTTVQIPAIAGPGLPIVGAPPGDFDAGNVFGLDYKTGYDIDLIAGYDFGAFRLEGELGFKRASLDELNIDDSFIAAINTDLNRPSALPDPGAPGLPAFIPEDFELDDKVQVASFMVNALADFGDDDGLSFYAGLGFGRAKVEIVDESDSAWAAQLIAGARYAISDNIDIGLKYRYFRTTKLDLADDDAFVLAGNPERVNVGTVLAPINVDRTTNAVVSTDFESKFRSHSLLASLIFNFGGPSEPPPPPPPPPAPPPPATQTCPDGSVILATDVCPAPPPPPAYVPPPPPEPAPERG